MLWRSVRAAAHKPPACMCLWVGPHAAAICGANLVPTTKQQQQQQQSHTASVQVPRAAISRSSSRAAQRENPHTQAAIARRHTHTHATQARQQTFFVGRIAEPAFFRFSTLPKKLSLPKGHCHCQQRSETWPLASSPHTPMSHPILAPSTHLLPKSATHGRAPVHTPALA